MVFLYFSRCSLVLGQKKCCKTIFFRPISIVTLYFSPPPHHPRHPPRPSNLTPKILAKIQACRPCIKPDSAVNGKRKKSNALCYLNLFDVLSCEIRRFKPAQNCFSSSKLLLIYLLVLFNNKRNILRNLTIITKITYFHYSQTALGPLLAVLGSFLGRSWAILGALGPLLAALRPLFVI